MRIALATAFAPVALLFAQSIASVSYERIEGVEGASSPVLSNDGRKLIYGSTSAPGLWLLDLATNEVVCVSSAVGADRGATFGNDGSRVVYRESFDAGAELLYALAAYDVRTGEREFFGSPRRDVGPPIVTNAGSLYYIEDNNAVLKTRYDDVGDGRRAALVAALDEEIYLRLGGLGARLAPFGELPYAQPTLSNRQRFLAFVVRRMGAFVMDVESKRVVASFSDADFPTFSADESVVIFRKRNERKKYELYYAPSLGGVARPLLPESAPEVFTPSSPRERDEIVFADEAGLVYIIDFETTE
ncbi:MAG: hypothetical protein GF419_00495 [Ignavibacteriales bacterium]|nr:hypothetical protein [Ignavibacteriales bacterium]